MKNQVMTKMEVEGKIVEVSIEEWKDNFFKNYKPQTIAERLEMTLNNIEFQNGVAYWDDIEKLELIVENLKSGKKISDEFEMFI
jgi:hypothetical protein